MNKRNLMTLMAAAAVAYSGAQINSPDPVGFMARGGSMFSCENYVGAMQQLRHAASSRELTVGEREQLEYLEAMSAFRLGDPDARQLLEMWLEHWPESVRRADVMMSVADCVFLENYAEALKLYEAIDAAALPDAARRNDLTYRKAYCLLKLGEYDRALTLFSALENCPEYANAAKFYKAYMAYARHDYKSALALFGQVDTSGQPGCMADYYLSQIYFMENNYRRAYDTASKLLKRSDVETPFVAETNRIAGESLYQMDDAAAAIPYLKKYVALEENPLPSTLYILGLSYYKDGDYREAVKTLRPVTAADNAMAQAAYLYIGQSLLKLGDTDGAIMAFDQATRMTHDLEVTETAYYNYAVAKYSGGNVPFGSSVKVFEDFLTRFPKSSHSAEVRQYIINGYLTDNNYQAALDAIERVPAPSAQVLAAKQRVLYSLGVQDLQAGRISHAVSRLTQARALAKYNPDYARETNLALGEALYRNGDYREAITALKAFLGNKRGASAKNVAIGHFDLGYAYLAEKQYKAAAAEFRNALDNRAQLSSDILADVYNRLGDCHYYLKDWDAAADAYDHAYDIMPEAGDYALFQKAMMQGYAGNFAGKLSGMRRLVSDFPTSSMLPDAMLEMTEAQLRTSDNDGAIATWKQLIARYPDTAQGRQAYLQMALTLASIGKEAESEKAYREIISKYPTSDEAAQAAEILKRSAADNGTLDDYMAFIESIDNAPRMDSTEAERLMYNAARQRAEEKGDFSRLKEYVTRYENGRYASAAYAMLLENAITGNSSEADGYATVIIDNWPDSKAAEDAYGVRARTFERQGRGEDALEAWSTLARKASDPSVATDARMGVIRVARDLGKADILEQASQAVLASTAVGAAQKSEATFSLGLAQSLKGDNSAAIGTWKTIAGETSDVYGAKAAVYAAEALLKDGKVNEASAAAKKFTQSDTPHSYWLARGFIVYSDALRQQGKTYEADEYLKAVRDNYPGTEADIFSMIDERLK
ncbi:MAG: tetratricopeptide repeat protein [Bacteroidales bacterium]|nr:tetratricopeptide repeat protein [Bacteroidales bacterium]